MGDGIFGYGTGEPQMEGRQRPYSNQRGDQSW